MQDFRDVRNFEKGFPVGSIEKNASSEMGIFLTFFEAKSVCYVSFVLGGSIDPPKVHWSASAIIWEICNFLPTSTTAKANSAWT